MCKFLCACVRVCVCACLCLCVGDLVCKFLCVRVCVCACVCVSQYTKKCSVFSYVQVCLCLATCRVSTSTLYLWWGVRIPSV